MICPNCEEWIRPVVNKQEGQISCPSCGFRQPRSFPPLFVVTGPSGGGKSAIVPHLQRLLPDWEVFETDILWDSAGSWDMVKANWFRIADSLTQRPNPRPTILCGTLSPEDVSKAGAGDFFGELHFLALTCDAETLASRLRERPTWRGVDEVVIRGQERYRRWLIENGDGAFSPPLELVDTSDEEISITARRVAEWASDSYQAWKAKSLTS